MVILKKMHCNKSDTLIFVDFNVHVTEIGTM